MQNGHNENSGSPCFGLYWQLIGACSEGPRCILAEATKEHPSTCIQEWRAEAMTKTIQQSPRKSCSSLTLQKMLSSIDNDLDVIHVAEQGVWSQCCAI